MEGSHDGDCRDRSQTRKEVESVRSWERSDGRGSKAFNERLNEGVDEGNEGR